MTEIESKRALAILFAAFPIETRNVPSDEALATARVYERALLDLDATVVSRAIDRLIGSCERLPTVAKIRSACMELQRGRKRPGGDAWGDVRAAMMSYGSWRTPGVDFAFEDPLVARAVTAFGWMDLCGSEDTVADRARFIQLYDALEENTRLDAQLSPGAKLVQMAAPKPQIKKLEAVPLKQLVSEFVVSVTPSDPE